MSISKTMNAVVMHKRGGPEVLKYETFQTPKPGRSEVLIKVHAATINHTDIFHRTGKFFIQKDLPHILGMDVAGVIAEVGTGINEWNVGDRIVATFEALGRERNGAYAEYTVVPSKELRKIPDELDFVDAASIGLAFTTAWIALFYAGKLERNETVVIHAAASGVGTAAIQIAKWMGCKVMAIGDLNKLEKLKELGADHVLDRHSQKLDEEVKALTGGKGANLILELVGRTTLQSSISMLANHGRIICVGTLSGDKAEINIMDLIMKAGSIRGSFGIIEPKDFTQILDLFAQKIFKPVIDSISPLSEASAAHERIEKTGVFGKVILVP